MVNTVLNTTRALESLVRRRQYRSKFLLFLLDLEPARSNPANGRDTRRDNTSGDT